MCKIIKGNEQTKMNKLLQYIKKRKYIFIVLIVAAVIALFRFYKCPLRWFLGIPCPCCGFSRAALSLLKFDFAEAFYYHPLWPLFLIAIIGFILYDAGVIRLSNKQFNTCIFLLVFAILVCFIIRHITKSSVVEISFEDSFLYRIFSYLIK